jgi:membrane-associated progesterone receptor component
MAAEAETLFTPLNIILGGVVGYMLYTLVAPAKAASKASRRPVDSEPRRDFTLKELLNYNGTKAMASHNGEKPIYMGVNGLIFDVTDGADFYGPGVYLLSSCNAAIVTAVW